MGYGRNFSLRKSLKAEGGPSGGSAAVLVVIIAAILVLYILVLPPDVREQLLGNSGSGSSSGGSGSSGTGASSTNPLILLNEHVGTLTSISSNVIDHDMPSFRIFDTTKAQIIKETNSIYVKSSALSKQTANVTFSLNPVITKNVKLAFNVKVGDGILVIRLNGVDVASISGQTGSVQPIVLPREAFMEDNTLTFEAVGPGWAFWRVNEFLLQPITIVGDVTDVSGLQAEQSFSVSSSEAQNLDTATLFYIPDCQVKQVGPLEIFLNKGRIFKGIADCGVKNHLELDIKDLAEGKNSVMFQTSYGSYLIDRLNVQTTLKESVHPVYYFDLDTKYFTRSTSQDAQCGQYDGICPPGCSETNDPDCCYDTHTYWCTAVTSNVNDRCVDYATSSQCSRCPTGYQDSSGNIPDPCKNACGDDNDGICPVGCSKYYDKDCCYNETKDNYWCNEVPLTGMEDKCTPNVGQGQCANCPSNYVSYNRGSFSCPEKNLEQNNQAEKLLSSYDLNVSLSFAGEDTKKLDVVVNGNKISVDTNRRSWSRLVDIYAQSGTNTIELVPRNDLEIATLMVQLKHRS